MNRIKTILVTAASVLLIAAVFGQFRGEAQAQRARSVLPLPECDTVKPWDMWSWSADRALGAPISETILPNSFVELQGVPAQARQARPARDPFRRRRRSLPRSGELERKTLPRIGRMETQVPRRRARARTRVEARQPQEDGRAFLDRDRLPGLRRKPTASGGACGPAGRHAPVRAHPPVDRRAGTRS